MVITPQTRTLIIKTDYMRFLAQTYIATIYTGLLIIFALGHPAQAWAQNIEADVVVSYGTRRLETQETLAYTLHILDNKSLEKSLPRTVPESLSALPGVMVQKTASGHGSPYIRGFTGNRTLAVLDGIRYNNATYRDGANEYFSHIDMFTLNQIEVLSGPASTLYGSEAVGGTLVLRTQDSGFLQHATDTSFIEGQQIFRISSGDQSVISRTALNIGKGGRWGARLGLSIKDFGDVRAAKLGRLAHTGYGETAWDGRIDGALNDIWNVSLVHQDLRQDDVWRTHSTIYSKPFTGTIAGTDLERLKDQARSLTYLKFNGADVLSFVDKAEITFSHQPRTESEHRVHGNGKVIEQSFSSNLLALNAVFESTFLGVNMTYGFDQSHETIDSNRTDFDPVTQVFEKRIQGPVGDDAIYKQTGLFLQNTFTLADDLSVEFGGRLSNISADIRRFEDPQSHLPVTFVENWSDFSSTLRVQYQWGNQARSSLWGAISEAFRAPNIADISRFGRSRSNEFEVASQTLTPEKFTTGEIGYTLHGQNYRLSASYYYTHMRDYIDTIPTGRVFDTLLEVSKSNSAHGHVQGVEISGNISLNHGLSLDAHATWLEGTVSRYTGDDSPLYDPISRIMPLTGYAALNWSGANTWVTGELTLVAKADKLSAGDRDDTQRIPVGGTPAYTLFNFKTGWDISERVQFTFSANNLLNQAYRVHGSGSNEPGRHVTAGINISF